MKILADFPFHYNLGFIEQMYSLYWDVIKKLYIVLSELFSADPWRTK